MTNQNNLISELFQIRNQYGIAISSRKKALLGKIIPEALKKKEVIKTYYDTLLFLLAYPDNKLIYETASSNLQKMGECIQHDENLRYRFFNRGVTGSQICAEFSFEIVKWLRKTYQRNVFIDSITAPDGQVLAILSAVLPQVEGEILQDENSTWQLWLKKCTKKGEDLLDTLLAVFEQSSARTEVKDQLWAALSMYITINLTSHTKLPPSLTSVYYHRSLIKHGSLKERPNEKPVKIKLTETEAEKIIGCARIVLVRYTREIDPISFSQPSSVSYYQLPRGLSIALFGMKQERRRPIDSYMGYMAFKNGLPFAYAGSWHLFDSGRIGLNVFTPFRGGESLHTFEQILKLHKHVYHLNRFSVDPYQLGKNNHDGIKSGAFWIYHKLGFRPIKEEQNQLAETEFKKQKTQKGYRSPEPVMKKLSDSRLELVVGKNSAVRFDATDLSLVYFNIVQNKYAGNRKAAEEDSLKKLGNILHLTIQNEDETLKNVLKNWCVLLIADEKTLRSDKSLIAILKKIFTLKSHGSEEEYIRQLQRSVELKKFVEGIVEDNLFLGK